MKILRQDIDNIISDDEDIWTFGNSILYNLCSEFPRHDQKSIVVAKVWLIGRSYSASIERRRPSSIHGLVDNDRFYENIVAPALMDSSLDQQIQSIRRYPSPTSDNIPSILDLHMYLMGIFKKITNLDKRSLASKYLHFHLPHLFYIYDSRACKGLSQFSPQYRSKRIISGNFDKNYKDFSLRLLTLQEEIEHNFGILLLPRQLDRLLLRKKA